ncbi:MAG: hypothetical protein HGA44_14995 [Cellulomonadaceae bacterium]|nr:hypothetical protein [Cellulomonadaceae bacterium]
MLLVAVLVAAAYQWPSAWFRGLAGLAVLGAAFVITSVGLHALAVEDLTSSREKTTSLDQALAGLDPADGVDGSLSALLTAVGARYEVVAADSTSTQEARNALLSLYAAVDGIEPSDLMAHGPHAAAYQDALDDLADKVGAVDGAPPALGAAYRAVTRAFDRAAAAWGDSNAAQKLIGAACTASGGAFTRGPVVASRPEVCVERSGASPTSVGAATKAVAQADLAVAEAAVSAGSASEEELAHLATAQEALADALARPDIDRPARDAAAAATAGLERLLNVPQQPWLPTLALWVGVAIVLALAYRSLEILNAGVDPVPIRIDGDVKVGEADLKGLFRHHLLTNLPEPAVQPGPGAPSSITDLLTADVIQSKALKFAIAVLNAIGLPPRGYVVTVSALPPVAEDAATSTKTVPARVTVSVRAERSSKPVHVITARGDDGVDAVVNAAYQVVSWVLGTSRGVPPWLQWKTTEAQAFARSAAADSKRDVATCSAMVGLAPASAQLRVALGQAYDLAGGYSDAEEQYEIASTMWEDYTVARYRLAIAATNAAGAREPHDVGADPSDQETAQNSYRAVKVMSSIPMLAVRKLSVRERRQTGPWRDCLAQHRAVELARRTSIARFADRSHVQVSDRGLGPREWQGILDNSRSALVLYNGACALLSRDPAGKGAERPQAVERAKELLRRLPACPDVDRVSAAWLAKDPDLASREIREERGWLLQQLAPAAEPVPEVKARSAVCDRLRAVCGFGH